jgi:hypothetical protein
VKVSEKAKGFALLDQIIAGDGAVRAKAGGNGLPLAKIARPADQRYASSAVHSGARSDANRETRRYEAVKKNLNP